jgi:hypothetical protein
VCVGPVALHSNSVLLQRYFVITCDNEAMLLSPCPLSHVMASLPRGEFNASVAVGSLWQWQALEGFSAYSFTASRLAISMSDSVLIAVNSSTLVVWTETNGVCLLQGECSVHVARHAQRLARLTGSLEYRC